MHFPVISNRRLTSLLLLAFAAALPSFLTSCVVAGKRDIAPGYNQAKISKLKTFYVRKDEQDDDNLGQDIADQLIGSGLKASAGTSLKAPAGTDAIITYKDRWAWDITMYMLSLDLQMRDPSTNAVIATANVTRTSLARKSQKEMVRETVAKLITN